MKVFLEITLSKSKVLRKLASVFENFLTPALVYQSPRLSILRKLLALTCSVGQLIAMSLSSVFVENIFEKKLLNVVTSMIF